MATYVISDIHGEYDQFISLIKKMNLTDKDDLYILGDVVDRGKNPIKVLKYLMTLPNCICIAGNHEIMALTCMKYMLNEVTDDFVNNISEEDIGKILEWNENGAATTIAEFSKLSKEERNDIIDFLEEFEAYVELEIGNKEYILVHAGLGNFSRDKYLDEYSIDELVWSRTDYSKAYYNDVIVVTGHTPTQLIKENPRPGYIFKGNNNIAIDCGAFSDDGRLAGICLETDEEFYSR